MVDAGAEPMKSDLLLMNITVGKITQLWKKEIVVVMQTIMTSYCFHGYNI